MNQLKLDFRSKLNLSPAFADWLERLLEPELEQRFATAKQAQKALKYRSIRQLVPQPSQSSFKHWVMAVLLVGAVGIGTLIRYPYKFLVLIEDGRPVENELVSGEISLQHFLNRGGSTAIKNRYAPALFAAALLRKNEAITQEMFDSGLDLSKISANGQTLAQWVEQGRQFNEAEVFKIAQSLLETLNYLQAFTPPIIHRDIKPQNILLDDLSQVYLVDFGAVQDTYRHTVTGGSTVVGTFGYMAPKL